MLIQRTKFSLLFNIAATPWNCEYTGTEHKCTSILGRPALNLQRVGDKNWMSAALIHISLKNAAHVHLYSARRERVRNGKRRRVALGGTMTPLVPQTCRVS